MALSVLKDWSPPQSPLRIECADQFWTRFQPDSTRIETSGLIYGNTDGELVRLIGLGDKGGEAPVGIYFLRTRGEIFMTESNVAAFEENRAAVALVIAGRKAGFFVRDAEGALQSIRSYQEFAVPHIPVKHRKAPLLAGVLLAASLPLGSLLYLHSSVRTPLAIRQNGNLLTIVWKAGGRGELQISEGALQTTIPIAAGQSTASYIRHGAEDVSVVLTFASRPALLRGALF
jgi:hypothetical protein